MPDFTAIQAKLLSDSVLRREFFADRDKVIASFSLSAGDARLLSQLDADELETQAVGLLQKRMREAARIAPHTFHRLGGSARSHFFAYAGQHWPVGHRRHVLDALAFCRYLVARRSPGVCRAELDRLAFALGKSRATLRLARDVPVKGRYRPGVMLLTRNGCHVRARTWCLDLPWSRGVSKTRRA